MANKIENKTHKTVKPKGLSLSRSGGNFVLTYKICDTDYGAGQDAQYRLNGKGKWTTVAGVGKTTTKFTVKINLDNYYPYKATKLTKIEVRVRGTRKNYVVVNNKKKIDYHYKCSVSDWATESMTFSKPNAPTVSFALGDNYYTSNLSVSTGSNGSDKIAVRRIYYQMVLLENCSVKGNEGHLVSGWEPQLYANGTSYSRTISETTSIIAQHSHTRWVKVWASGIAGDSAPVYVRHVYATPFKPIITGTKATLRPYGYDVVLDWKMFPSEMYPIDQSTVQYAVVTRGAVISNWQDVNTAAGTRANERLAFPVDQLLTDDQAMYFRVNSKHDNNVAYGDAQFSINGPLSDPSNLNVERDDTTFRATIEARNNSAAADSFLVVRYMDDTPSSWDIGIIPHGQDSVTVQCPNWTGKQVKFGVRAVCGTAKATPRADGVGSYAITSFARSAEITGGGVVPVAPANVDADRTDIAGTIHVTWDWSWQAATVAEISWSNHVDAWESTDEPETYQVNSMHASAWNISGLETGIVWYVRVRLGIANGDAVTWGPYGEAAPVDLSSAPVAPSIEASTGAIAEDGDITFTWTYSTTDGTGQAAATLALVTTEGSSVVYESIADVLTAQSITLNAADLAWETGQSYAVAVQVTSTSGHTSEWSDPITVYVVEPLTAVIAETSLVEETITIDGVSMTINALKAMPLTVTITGAGDAGTTTLAIERRADYEIDRPDESQLTGYAGETIVLYSQKGEDEIVINRNDMSVIGRFDDGALYRLVATVSDTFGQSDMATLDFEVDWTNQALMPIATVEIDEEQMIAKILPTAPAGAAVGDTVDIYRLSVDKPVLIYEGAVFGTIYVDPFPTLGDLGGYRIVYKTLDGDYITEDKHLAWLDIDESVDSDYNIIDFGTGRVSVQYNIDLSHSWTKDFKETKYLGGTVQGDWNPAVTRTGTVNGAVITSEDYPTIEALRRLAVYPGICHVRTKDGSSFACNIDVSEDSKQSTAHKISTFTLRITRIDPEDTDGMTLAEWNALHDED